MLYDFLQWLIGPSSVWPMIGVQFWAFQLIMVAFSLSGLIFYIIKKCKELEID